MDSEMPPQKRIKLATTSKGQLEVCFSRFSHLTEQIFDNLDNAGLSNCSVVSRQWQSYLEDKRFFQIRIIKSKMAKDGKVGKSWDEFFKASTSKAIKYLAGCVTELCENNTIDERFGYLKFDESLTPLHVAAIEGKLSLFKYVFFLSKSKEPTTQDG
jgi:hypothetical protein